MTGEIAIYVLLFLILLALSALFSGSETAFFSLPASILERFKKSRIKSEKRVAALMQNPRQLLITIVVGNTVVNITTASLAAILTTRVGAILQWNSHVILVIDVLVVTFVLLIVSEILPKVMAVRNAEKFARRFSGFIQFTYYLFFPVTYLLARFTSLLQHRLGLKAEKTQISEDELLALADVGEEYGTLEEEEREIIHSIFEFGETTVKEIMVPRTDMVCIEVHTPYTELLKIVRGKLHSRIPIYKERIDNIVGILYIKDLLPYLYHRKKGAKIDLTKLMREPYFVPEQKKISELLKEFQKNRIHMALVVDEYGGIAGLVTLEDIIEEIVGEIQDEYDKELPMITRINETTFVVDGRMQLEELNEELHLNLPEESGVETISGFILNLMGSVPKEKEKVRYNGYLFTVEQVIKNRIKKVKIEKIPSEFNIEEKSR
ncbi:MAG: HlyC/CorC family transporter [Calditrichaeota bacterium]|nr:MAG: HlyC/CorC family transporter [Calditrichota bacterium]